MKFACFERTVEAIYANIVPKPRAECTKGEQLIVTFAAGYIAGGETCFYPVVARIVTTDFYIYFRTCLIRGIYVTF